MADTQLFGVTRSGASSSPESAAPASASGKFVPTAKKTASQVLHLFSRCYTPAVPTARPRHMITETDEIARAIDAAARRWPDSASNRAELLRLLVMTSDVALEQEREARRTQRTAAIRHLASIGIANPPGWPESLRDEWPE